MKTRQEMIYDFMVALAANPRLHEEWDEYANSEQVWAPPVGSFGSHVLGTAEELADAYLRTL